MKACLLKNEEINNVDYHRYFSKVVIESLLRKLNSAEEFAGDFSDRKITRNRVLLNENFVEWGTSLL